MSNGNGIEKYCFLLCVSLFLCTCLYAETPKAAVVEKEYSDAVVLLIDAKSGMIGVTWKDEKAEKEEKLSFKVDPDKIDVLNSQNEYLEFFDVYAGDHVDIVTLKDLSGKETVVEILDYDAHEPGVNVVTTKNPDVKKIPAEILGKQ